MDFLTQPTVTNSEPSPSPPSPPTTSAESASLISESTINDKKQSQTSPLPSSDPFNQLRTAQTDSNGIEGEQKVDWPNIKKGDWRTFSKVEARVVVWQDGRLRKEREKKKDEKVEMEWVLEGVLWVTHDKQIFFIIDTQIPPRSVPLTSPKLLKKYRRSSLSFTKTLSFGTSSPPPEQVFVEDDEEGEDNEVAKEEGLKGIVKKIFSFGNKDKEKEGNEGLSRQKTKEGMMSRSRSRSRSKSELSPVQTRMGGGVASGEIEKACPLPTYKNYSVTALHIPSFSHLLTHRYHPSRATAGSHSPTTLFSISPSSQSPIDAKSSEIDYPRVEIDVAKPTGSNATMEEGKARDVTVGFLFLDRFMAKEAEDFDHQLNEHFGNLKK